MNPGFQIGGVTLYFYGLILSLATLLAFLTAKFLAYREKFPQDTIDEAAIVLIIPVIFGARIYHLAHFWDYYSENLAQIFFIWQGGTGIIGGIVGGILALFLYSKLKKLPFLKLTDLAAPALALGQSLGRIGNFVNREGFGSPTNLPWGVFITPEKRPENFANLSHFHPTFFYESLGVFLIFLVLIILPFKKTGSRTGVYLISYSILRFGLEFFRIDTWQVGIIKIAQIISVAGLLAGVTIFAKISQSGSPIRQRRMG